MDKARQALTFIDSTDRKTWVEVGMALKDEYGADAFELFDSWSSSAYNYCRNAVKSSWRSFKSGGGIGIGTLFLYARRGGWVDSVETKQYTPAEIAEWRAKQEARRIEEAAKQARLWAQLAQKAEWIISQCKTEQHAYLDSKGFKDLKGLVWRRDENSPPVLCIPMYFAGRVCSIQFVSVDGEKRFLKDGRTSDAYFKFGTGRKVFLCEGYATALSLQAVLSAMREPYSVIATFSAHNLVKVSKLYPDAFVVADNDKSDTGAKAAIETGCAWWMPPDVGDDFNDLQKREGVLKASFILRDALAKNRKRV